MQPRAKTRRLFFALWPTDALRQSLDAASRPLLAGHSARGIPAENFHVTLAFLGAVSETLFEPIKVAAHAVRSPSFEFQLDRVEVWRRAELLCVTVSSAPNELAQLVGALRSELARLQFEPDHKEFKPHVTLARDWRGAKVEQPFGPFPWQVREFVLVESHSGPRGSRYEVLERWPLATEKGA